MTANAPTTAQLATFRRIRSVRDGDVEIAATEFVDGLLRMYFASGRVTIFSHYNYDGSTMFETYGTRRIGRFGEVTVKRPVDLLAD